LAIGVQNATREVLDPVVGVQNATREVVEPGDWGSKLDTRGFELRRWSSEPDVRGFSLDVSGSHEKSRSIERLSGSVGSGAQCTTIRENGSI